MQKTPNRPFGSRRPGTPTGMAGGFVPAMKGGRTSGSASGGKQSYSGIRSGYMILSSPYTFPQFRIGIVHFFVASKVAR